MNSIEETTHAPRWGLMLLYPHGWPTLYSPESYGGCLEGRASLHTYLLSTPAMCPRRLPTPVVMPFDTPSFLNGILHPSPGTRMRASGQPALLAANSNV